MPVDFSDANAVEGLGTFFDTIWRDTSGYVYLPTLDRKNANAWSKSMFRWPENRPHIINHVLGKAAAGLDVYYAPVLFDREKEPKPIKENVLGSWVCWAEYDGSAVQEWTPETAIVPGGPPAAPVPPPTLRIASSVEGKEHCYWELDTFNKDVPWIENTNRSITYSTRADTSGWDINQVLRPPYTINYKYPENPHVTIIHASRDKYPVGRFASLKPVIQLVAGSVNTEDLPTVEAVIAKYPWDADHFKFFMDSNIPQGERSAALMRLGYIGAEMGLGDKEIYAILDNADSRWKKYVGRADRKIRLLDILNRARTKHPTALSSLTFSGLTGVEDVEQDVKYLYSMQEFLDSDIEVEWAIDNFLEIGGLGMVAASPGVGKTQLSIQLGIACALGRQFLCWKPAKAMKVTFVSLEMSHVALKKFMQTIMKEYPDEEDRKKISENFTIMPLGESLQIDKEITRTFFTHLLEQSKPEGIIIDSLGKLSMSKLDEESVKTINHHLGVLRKQLKCFIWLIHHNRKSTENNKEPDSLDDIYGSMYITAEMTAVLLMHKKKHDDPEIKILNVKSRLAQEVPSFMVRRNANLFFSEASGGLGIDNLTTTVEEGQDNGGNPIFNM